MQKAMNKKSLSGILRIATQEALLQITIQICSKGNRKWQGLRQNTMPFQRNCAGYFHITMIANSEIGGKGAGHSFERKT